MEMRPPPTVIVRAMEVRVWRTSALEIAERVNSRDTFPKTSPWRDLLPPRWLRI